MSTFIVSLILAALAIAFLIWLAHTTPIGEGDVEIKQRTVTHGDEELGPHEIRGEWPFNDGDRFRVLVPLEEFGTQAGHMGTVLYVNAVDTVEYVCKLDGFPGSRGRCTFLETELHMLEKVTQ